MDDRAAWLQQRRRRYLAQILTDFEDNIEPLFTHSQGGAPAVERFKGLIRGRINALAVDAIDIFTKTERGTQINAHAQQLKDQLGSTTRSR